MENRASHFVFLLAVIGAAVLTGCEPRRMGSDNSPEDLYSRDGVSYTRHINGIRITVRFLSPHHLTNLAETKMGRPLKGGERDSLMRMHQGTLTFLMTLAPEEAEHGSGDIVSRGIISPPEFIERLTQLNFHMNEMTSLRIGETEINPVLASMENTGGLTSHRNIYIVFENSGTTISKSDSVAFVFRDDLFGTGMSYFPFAAQAIYVRR